MQVDRIFNHCRISETGDIIFHRKVYLQIYDVFMARYRLHKEVYSHKTVVAVEIMIVKYLRLLFTLPKVAAMWSTFSDDILRYAHTELARSVTPAAPNDITPEERKVFEQCAKIKDDIDMRRIPKFICERREGKSDSKVEDREEEEEWKTDTLLMEKLVAEGYEIFRQPFSLGFCSNKINPMNNISFYKNNSARDGIKRIEPHKISKLLANDAHEDITFYYKWKP